jgi:Zn-dependent protease with chaperone function
MSRHGPHILGLGKGIFLFCALVLFAYSGMSLRLVHALHNYFYFWPSGVYPAFWFIVMVAGLLLAFPITLAQDHLLRHAEGRHEEMPMIFWLRGLTVEIFIGTCIGCAVAAALQVQPTFWWVFISAGWITYHVIPQFLQTILATRDQQEKHSHVELLESLREPLNRVGMELSGVYTYSDDDNEEWLDKDMIFIREDKKHSLFIPHVWAATWTVPELTAVALHRHFLDQPRILFIDIVSTLASALACFGGFTLCLPWLTKMFLPHGSDPLTISALLAPWSFAVFFILGIPVMAIHRNIIFRADDFASRQMNTNDGIVAALERARKGDIFEYDPPRWVETLFLNNPSLLRRIQRMNIQVGIEDRS